MTQNTVPFGVVGQLLVLVRKVLSAGIVALLAMMSVVIVYQVVARYVFASPSNVSDELLRFSLIWSGILGAVVCFMHGTHLSLPIILDRMNETHRAQANIFNHVMSIA